MSWWWLRYLAVAVLLSPSACLRGGFDGPAGGDHDASGGDAATVGGDQGGAGGDTFAGDVSAGDSFSPLPDVEFVQPATMVAEGSGSVTVGLQLSFAVNRVVTVDFQVSGSAAAGVDFNRAPGTVTFGPNVMTGSLDVSILEDDHFEVPETVLLTLSAPSGAELGAFVTHLVTIDDLADLAPRVIAAGENHTCTVVGGAARCWGNNGRSMLGVSVTALHQSASPVTPDGMATGVTDVALDYRESCGLTAGRVRCVGDNSSSHVELITSGAQSVSGQRLDFCAIVNYGLWCWGGNSQGIVGPVGSSGGVTNPVVTRTFTTGVTEVAMAGLSMCAVVNETLRCWGGGSNGQLGDGNATSSGPPVTVLGLPGPPSRVDAGETHVCAVVAGALYCWGNNDDGQLGIPGGDLAVATLVPGLASGVSDVSCGWFHTCAVVDGGVECMGWNSEGQLGDGTDISRDQPTPVTNLGPGSGATAVAVGHRHSCAVVGNTVQCWGFGGYGQAGDLAGALRATRTTPALVPDATLPVTALGVAEESGAHTCAADSGGVICWGENDDSQVTADDLTIHPRPVPVFGWPGGGVVGLALGRQHSCAAAGNAAICWGSGSFGQVGVQFATREPPLTVAGLDTNVTAVAAGDRFSCAIQSGQVMCWGSNGAGALGRGTSGGNDPIPLAATATGFADVTAIDASDHGVCAIANANTEVWCWGNNGDGRVGVDTGGSSVLTPTEVTGFTGAIDAVSTNSTASCAIEDGTIFCWGSNWGGQLGTTGATDSFTPVAASNSYPAGSATALSSGGGTTCAIAAGNVFCWGIGTNGRVGDGQDQNTFSPSLVTGFDDGTATLVAVGQNASCALRAAGIFCWGEHLQGQVGDGVAVQSSTPSPVTGL